MKRVLHVFFGLTLFGAMLGTFSTTSHAALACRGSVICDQTLGIALKSPAGWMRLPAHKVAPYEFDFVTAGAGPHNLRLVIRAYAVTSLSSSQASVRLAARKLVASERVNRVAQHAARYGGAPAIVMRGLPGPAPAADILIAHGRYVYLVIVPGRAMAADQQAALGSFRFIRRVGPFPGEVSGGR